MMEKDGIRGPLKAWDWRYYAEKRRLADHNLNETELKPYLKLEQMIAAAFDCASRLFGLSFKEVKQPLYHPDARVWEVSRNGRHLALLNSHFITQMHGCGRLVVMEDT